MEALDETLSGARDGDGDVNFDDSGLLPDLAMSTIYLVRKKMERTYYN
jgi:hypothetical protein